MKAVYQCKQKCLSLNKHEVNLSMIPNYDEMGNIIGFIPHIPHPPVSYHFLGGKERNQLTLTDPTEIRNMRAYINRRHDDFITEVFFEGSEDELEDPVVETPAELIEKSPEKETPTGTGLSWEDLDECDIDYITRLLKR